MEPGLLCKTVRLLVLRPKSGIAFFVSVSLRIWISLLSYSCSLAYNDENYDRNMWFCHEIKAIAIISFVVGGLRSYFLSHVCACR
jgi:hypothetical protein